ncbi:MAG: DNA polymerase III subunit beta [Gammaproteobacteria bacterium CG_4_10_14_0_8_um_filter_38_16]|nr:MAG: DNA polymerase III subunit beta [Gammaproteobacteria bacterium CG_4_10_14_0_8_um_filter_38_16]PJA03217.1 MAG: DNA polymerase III subunit beta [Gammaproteobacteria bacterium CG_4_10_14_0_2_um_filter_38_22]PJB10911.1 MAG: DNA polymerase III subunit beta [Gammaproteobacteria bacterium CG_4_9_14_3_um_filter_38_9]
MKLTLQREQLLKPLQLVIGAVDHKQAMPILSNVLLQVTNKKLSVTGTDLEIELIGQSDLTHADTIDAKLTLPARKLFDICKALPESSSIELYQDRDRVTLKANRSRFTMSTLSADEFPSVESSESSVTFTITQEELSTLLHRTAFAMAQQDVRYYLNGMLFEIADNVLRVVATDGHRLALNQTNIQSTAQNLQVIVPYKAVMELMRLLKDADKLLTIHLGHHHVRIFCDNFVFTSKLVEGRFPDYQRVIPKMGDKTILVDRDILKQALLRTAILCHDKVRGVRFELQKGNLKLSANNPEHEAAEEEMDVQYQGDNLDVGFNITYLLDVLSVVNVGSVRLTLIDTNSSMRIDEPGNEASSIFVVMPMRI